jgi:hypothetical protein
MPRRPEATAVTADARRAILDALLAERFAPPVRPSAPATRQRRPERPRTPEDIAAGEARLFAATREFDGARVRPLTVAEQIAELEREAARLRATIRRAARRTA